MASKRIELIARTAVALIAERGLRGLTHRAVDEAAGLPPGSTSYHARTRAKLIETALTWMADTEERDISGSSGTLPRTVDASAQLIAEFLHTAITRERRRTLARLNLALEAGRHPQLRATYHRLGARFRHLTETLLRDLGSPEPVRHTRMVIAWCEGMIFDSLVGGGSAGPPTPAELRTGTAELLGSLLAGTPHRDVRPLEANGSHAPQPHPQEHGQHHQQPHQGHHQPERLGQQPNPRHHDQAPS